MLAPTLLLQARSAVPVVAVRTVVGGACGNSFFRVWAEELKAGNKTRGREGGGGSGLRN